MPKNLKRIYGQGTLHFITCSCYRRRPLFRSARARNTFVRILDEVRKRYGFALYGYVVMPEHIHVLMGEPKKGTPSTVMQVLKQRLSRELRRRKRRALSGQLTLPFAHLGEDLPHFWQRRFYDFNVWSGKKIREKLEYMHQNPVKRGLVSVPSLWVWSSYNYYEGAKEPLLMMDLM